MVLSVMLSVSNPESPPAPKRDRTPPADRPLPPRPRSRFFLMRVGREFASLASSRTTERWMVGRGGRTFRRRPWPRRAHGRDSPLHAWQALDAPQRRQAVARGGELGERGRSQPHREGDCIRFGGRRARGTERLPRGGDSVPVLRCPCDSGRHRAPAVQAGAVSRDCRRAVCGGERLRECAPRRAHTRAGERPDGRERGGIRETCRAPAQGRRAGIPLGARATIGQVPARAGRDSGGAGRSLDPPAPLPWGRLRVPSSSRRGEPRAPA